MATTLDPSEKFDGSFCDAYEFEDEEKCEALTEAEADEMTNKLEQKESEMKEILEKLQKKKDGDVLAWFNGVSNVVLFSNAESKTFGELEDKVVKSIEAYEHFEKLASNKEFLLRYGERVEAARKIYRHYWKLLADTSRLMASIETKALSVEKFATLCEKSAQKSSDGSAIASKLSTSLCMKAINRWMLEQDNLNELRVDWQKLGDEATKEKTAWQNIEVKLSNKINGKWKQMIKELVVGLGIVVVAAGVSWFVGPFAAHTFLGVAQYVVPVSPIFNNIWYGTIFGVVAAGVAARSKIWEDYSKFQCARRGVKAMNSTLECVESIKSTIAEIAKQANPIEKLLQNLDNICTKVKGASVQVKECLEVVNDQDDATLELKEDCLKMVFEDIVSIKQNMQSIGKECHSCRTKVDEATEAILNLQSKK